MNILDENVGQSQRDLLRKQRIAVRKIGLDIGKKGLSDNEIVVLLHSLDRPTFFTIDPDFFRPQLCHAGYCLVFLDVAGKRVAEYTRRVLKHPQLNTRAKRMGQVLRATAEGLVG